MRRANALRISFIPQVQEFSLLEILCLTLEAWGKGLMHSAKAINRLELTSL